MLRFLSRRSTEPIVQKTSPTPAEAIEELLTKARILERQAHELGGQCSVSVLNIERAANIRRAVEQCSEFLLNKNYAAARQTLIAQGVQIPLHL